MKVTGGKSVYGADIGILMLEAQFPRIVGDMGNALTWDFPVRYRVVRDASPDLVVRQGAPDLLNDFISAGRELVQDGVELITTNCGFLSIFRSELEAALKVPVAASALEFANHLQQNLPKDTKLGILTISKDTLTQRHLDAANVPQNTPIWGVQTGCEFQRVILNDERLLDVEKAQQDMIHAAQDFQNHQQDLGAILFECTNMPPYADAVSKATGLPAYSIVDYIHHCRQKYLKLDS